MMIMIITADDYDDWLWFWWSMMIMIINYYDYDDWWWLMTIGDDYDYNDNYNDYDDYDDWWWLW